MTEIEWEREADVVVVGSGAAGLTAALTAAEGELAVELFEKSSLIGGTTSVSGGGVWVPGNKHMLAMGLDDSRAEAVEYAMASTDGLAPDPELVEVYVEKSVEAIEFLEARSPVTFFVAEVFSDYYLERPGSRRVGRTLDNEPFAARTELGGWDARVRRGPHYMQLTLDENSSGGADGADRGGGAGARGHDRGLTAIAAEREAAGIRTGGEALVTRLLRGALNYGTSVHTDAPVRRLILSDDHVVLGVRVQLHGVELNVRARRGVVLATGGFEWNQELVRAHLGIRELRPASPPTNTGDGVLMAMEAGALVANMTEAWWFPVTSTGTLTFEGHPMHNVGTPRAEAGCITVNRNGRRFTNEAACYMDLGRTFRAYDAVTASRPNEVAWSIFDQRVRDRIELADLVPGRPTPAWVHEAQTIEELAGEIGLDPNTLADEVRRFNGFVATGNDQDFGRGTLWFEGFASGGTSPEQALAPIEQRPFYALRLHNGALGTCGGPRVDAHGRVLAARGGVVEGLYAAGNAAASVFGPGYPAGGATLGPAITFAYLAGRHLVTG